MTGDLDTNDLHRVQSMTWEARSQWFNVGLGLGLSVNTLEAVRRTNQGDCDVCYTKTLVEWLRWNDPRPTWSTLAEALKSPTVDLGHLAEKLPKQ